MAQEAGSVTLRKKRRASSLHLPSLQPDDNAAEEVQLLPRTPVRQKKRVRFSFPPDASTGLTQRIARTQLLSNTDRDDAPTARLLAHKPRHPRRAVSEGSTQSVSLDANNIEIQFKPMRQVLSERTKRRLTRNHLSETMNEIEAEKKTHNAVCRELVQVKQELEELSAGRLPPYEDSERVRGLQDEIETLRRQLSDQSSHGTGSSTTSDLEAVDVVATFEDEPAGPDGSDISLELTTSRPETPTTPISLFGSRHASHNATPSTSKHAQTDMSSVNLDEIQEHLHGQAEHLKCVRLDLEHLFPGETPLPLASPTKRSRETSSPSAFPLTDAKPLITAMFEHLVKISNEAATTAQSLAAAEDQQSILNSNFRTALRQLDELRSAHAVLLARSQQRYPKTPAPSRSSSEDRSTSSDKENAPPSNTNDYERMFENAEKRVQKLEEEAATYEKDRAALIVALNKYRSEVKDLEKLITTMESEHKLQIQNLKSEHSAGLSELMAEHAQAIDSLETQIEVEARDRREAEAEIDKIVCRWGDQRERSERDTGRLNVQIATLTDQLKDRERSVDELHQHLAAVRERVEFFVSSVGGQLEWANIEAARAAASEPELPKQTAQRASSMPPTTLSWGLLTPSVEGGRFRDAMGGLPSPDLSSDPATSASVDGHIQVGRGKQRAFQRRRDNDIGIVMEDPGEE